MLHFLRWIGVGLLLVLTGAAQAASTQYASAGTFSWTVPSWVTSITVEAWGGGGAGGGQNQNSDGGGGGGGGAYSRSILTVTPGATYTVVVGAGGASVAGGSGGDGGDSHFGDLGTLLAKGGKGGSPSTGTPPAGAAGGAAAEGVGAFRYSGGNGGQGRDNNNGLGGPGGSSAGTAQAGTSGPSPWTTTTAAAAPAGGGIGGNGGANGADGAAPASGNGGGGGGSGEGSGRSGGNGAPGKVVITYPDPPVSPTATTDPATGVLYTLATLNGRVTPNDAATTVSFEYGLTTAYGSSIAATPSPLAAGTGSTAVSADLSGLTPGTTYHYRVRASSSVGTTYGADQTFTTRSPLTKTSSAASARVGDVITFAVTLANPATTPLTDAVMTDTLPAGMGYVTHVATLGTAVVSGQTVTWTVPSLPAGGSATLTLAVSLTQQGVLTNTVTSPGYGSASASVLVLASAVTHFRMDETAGSWSGAAGEVIDSGTTGLHGRRLTTTSPTATNAVSPNPTIAAQHTSVVGGFCNAASFDGNAVVQVADSPAFDYTTTLSASAWIYPTQRPGAGGLYSILSNDVNYEFHLDPQGRLYWWWNASTLTSATTIPLNQWTHVAITFDSASGRQRIYINGVQDTNTNNWTGTLQANNCSFYIGGDIATGAACSLTSARNFRGSIDEVKLYSYELSAAEVQADMTLGRACSGTYDHIRIEHDGSGSVCAPETVTVKACLNAACTALYTGAVTVRLSPTGWVGGDTFAFSGGVTTRQLSSSTPGDVTLGTASATPLPAGAARCFNGGTESCTLNFANASCNFDAAEPGGGPQSRLYTKLAGTSFNVDVLALSNSTTLNTSYTGTVSVDLVDSASSTCPTGSGLNTATSVTFSAADAGRKPVALSYANAAANVRVRMKVGTGTPACSSDNFAIRPPQFTVSAPVLNNTGLTGTPKAVAGTDFALEAAAGVSSGYSGTTPVLDASQARDHNGVTIATGTLSGSFDAGDGSKASGATFKYLDVGNLQLGADAVVDSQFTLVDQAAGDCTAASTSNTLSGGRYGCSIGSAASGKFGRWHPSHYSFSGSLTAGCGAGGYTYMGQDALGVALSVKAHASTGATAAASDPVTSRYTAGYTGLAQVTLAGDNNGTAVDVTRLASPAFPSMPNAALWTAGVFQINDSYAFAKLAAPDGPYDSFKLLASLSDPDGGALIGTAAEKETGMTRIRHGRLRLGNAYGSELLDLPVTLDAQYWTGAGYAINALDSCTTIPAASITMGNYQGNLSACETRILPAGNLALANGRTVFTLRRPGAGNSGSVDLAVNAGTGSSGNTCVGGSETAAAAGNVPWFGPNLGARAAFGLYRAPIIYMRENY